ncbi:MAG TPA: porin family protein, partial [Planctomycetota bacterium]|nr:porin family protein [Planctomycetota bacterium]
QKSIRVTMSAPPGDDQTRFYDEEVERIIDTVSASVFERDARIGTKGLRAPSGGRHAFILTVRKDIIDRTPPPPQPPRRLAAAPPPALAAAAVANPRQPTLPDSALYESVEDLTRRSFPPAVEQALSWTCRAFRKTGAKITFDDVPNGPTFDDTEQAGAFGYVAGHEGRVERWTSDFSGQGLRRVADGVFALDVPHGRQGLVHTRIEAEEFHRFAVRFRLGFTAPHGDFADAVDGGWSETAGFEYRFDRMFSLEARLSVSSFDEDGGGSDITLVGHSLNGRATFLDGDWRPFVNAGGGFYLSNPGDDEFGLNAGGGVEWRASGLLSLEAAYDVHNVFTDDDDARFSTIQAGVALRF